METDTESKVQLAFEDRLQHLAEIQHEVLTEASVSYEARERLYNRLEKDCVGARNGRDWLSHPDIDSSDRIRKAIYRRHLIDYIDARTKNLELEKRQHPILQKRMKELRNRDVQEQVLESQTGCGALIISLFLGHVAAWNFWLESMETIGYIVLFMTTFLLFIALSNLRRRLAINRLRKVTLSKKLKRDLEYRAKNSLRNDNDSESELYNKLVNSMCNTWFPDIPRELTRAISREVKELVFIRDGGSCRHCGSSLNLEYDHIVPHSLGGSNAAINIQLLCRTCNRYKGNRFSY